MTMRALAESEGRDDRVSAALQRMQDGYPLPEFPTATGEWKPTYSAFMASFVAAARQRHSDSNLISDPEKTIRRYSRIVFLLCVAQTGRDLELIRCYLKMIMDSHLPDDISPCLKLLRINHSDAEATEIITPAHVDSYVAVKDAVEDLLGENYLRRNESFLKKSFGEELVSNASLICFENLDRTDTVTALIRSGMVEAGRLRAAVEDFDNADNVLLEGVL